MRIFAPMPVQGASSAPARRHRLTALAATSLGRVLRWHELARQRRALLALNERMLKDIGISRAEAEREGRRRFWDDVIEPWR